MAKSPLPPWMFKEFEPVGVDLDSERSVENYDRNQGTSAAADDRLLDRLGVGAGTVLVDLGTGTGSLPVRAAMRGAVAHAVDVSENMLAHTQRRAAEEGVSVRCHHAGFLSYRHEGTADVVVTRSSLHQLPDTWKQLALDRIAACLKTGGLFYVWDAMWSFDASAAEVELPRWIETMAREAGHGFTAEDFQTHVREEFSTYAWIIEGMIQRVGLAVLEKQFPAPWYGEFLAQKLA